MLDEPNNGDDVVVPKAEDDPKTDVVADGVDPKRFDEDVTPKGEEPKVEVAAPKPELAIAGV